MGLIVKPLAVTGRLAAETLTALFDSGASESFIREDIARRLGTPELLPRPRPFATADATLTVTETLTLDLEIDGASLFGHFLLAPRLSEEMIVGADFLQRWKIKLDPENEGIIFDPKALKLTLL